jgi:hypothetical protein
MSVRTLASRILPLLVTTLLAACGHSVRIQGTADEVWNDTVEILRIQGVMPATIPSGKERPRADRAKGEIDLLYTQSVYYGDGAAFIQVDVSLPEQSLNRRVRMWVDFPVGNTVVRYGRAIDERTSDGFTRDFEVAMAKFRETHAERLPPPPPSDEATPAAESTETTKP